jgi:hypothetical protein
MKSDQGQNQRGILNKDFQPRMSGFRVTGHR